MTLNGQNIKLAEIKKFYGAHQKNLNEDSPYYQWQNVDRLL